MLALRTTAALALLHAAAAWWADGHMLTAQIAYDALSATTKIAADELISLLATDYPTSPDFVTASCWADDIKSEGVTQYNNWHFVDLPVVRGGFWWQIPETTNSSINPWAISAAVTTLSDADSKQLDKAIQLRFLIHFVGDLHQPLHAASLFSSQFKSGDYGGNIYKIAGTNETNLHSYWDAGADQWAEDLVRPLNAEGEQWLKGWENTITTQWPQSAFANDLTVTNVYQWAVDSNGVADTVAYTAPQAPTPVPDSYKQLAEATTSKMVALGGYRLAQILESIFNPSAPNYGMYAKLAQRALLETAENDAEAATARLLRAGRN